MTFKKNFYEDNVIYSVHGQMSVSNFQVIDSLIKDIKNLIDFDKYTFVWNFKELGFMDSTGLSVIAMTIAHAMKNGKYVYIIHAAEEIARILKSSRMDKNIRYIRNLEEINTYKDEIKILNLVEDLN